MKRAKIKLSAHELNLAQNASFILTKNVVMQKTISLLGAVAEKMQAELPYFNLPEEVVAIGPKISKGENYKGLPYVILDYPRFFNHENVFAVRTMFWWGDYFTTTLHLKGIYKKMYAPQLKKNLPLLSGKNFSVSCSHNEWQHEHENNYVPLSCITEKKFAATIISKSFLKLSARAELSQWNNGEETLVGSIKDALRSILPC
ncbi:MAG: hypothetical protein JST47_08355 [Bacteroidetes bacterium]|nr:hypothetical protein [Bacteroidota bacterium]